MLYYPFGVRWQNTTGFGWDEKFAQFPQRDDDIQKYEASFREYAPGLGRWMSPDRLAGNIMNPQSLDRYTYALNNPVSNIDPLGLDPCPPGVSADVCVVGHTGHKGVPGQSDGPGPGTDRNTGAGGGGTAHHAFSWKRLNCASDYGDSHSIAAGIYAGKGKPDFATNLFLGNAVSAFANLFLIVAGEKAPTAKSFATHSLIGVGQGYPSKSPVVKGPAGVIQDAAVGGAYTAVRGLKDAPITGITGAAADAVGEGAASGAEGFAMGVGVLKIGFDALTFGYGYYEGCTP